MNMLVRKYARHIGPRTRTVLSKIKCLNKNVDQAPHRKDHEESDQAPHEILRRLCPAFSAFVWFYEILNDVPYEHNNGRTHEQS